MVKTILLVSVAFVVLGFILSVVFVVLSGLQYRRQEDLGLEPGPTPPHLALGIEAGFWVFGAGVVLLLSSAVLALVRRRRAGA